MSHNSARLPWIEDELQELLRGTKKGIHDKCVQYGRERDGYVDYLKEANIAGFVKVADAMLAYCVICLMQATGCDCRQKERE
jgi:glutamate dehydrogenase (NADP+)